MAFEEKTFEALMEEYLSYAPSGVDTREGSIYWDAGAGFMLILARHYIDLDLIQSMSSIVSATGDALDSRASEYGVERKAATPARYYVTIEGTVPEAGTRFYYDGQYFVLYIDDDGTLFLQAEEAGESGNNIYAGTIAVPVTPVEGLISCIFGEIYEHGTDEESDDSLRLRVQEVISGGAQNGNKQHYKNWCESVEGVGLARIYPLWNGPNTVKAVLIDGSGNACSDAKVAEVQEYVDPATMGYTAEVGGRTYVVGDGLGEGVANLGAHFTAAAPLEVAVSVAFTAELRSGYSADDVAEEATEAIRAYMKELALTEGGEDGAVRLTAVGAIIADLPGVLDYSDLTLNGGTDNIYPGEDIAVLGEVSVN